MRTIAAAAWGIAMTLAAGAAPADWEADLMRWRAERVERLTAPAGWLALAGLHWLERGRHALGSGSAATIRIAQLPEAFGTLEVSEHGYTLTLVADVAATVDGAPAAGRVVLASDAAGPATRVAHGPVEFAVIERGGRPALRVWDAGAPTRTGFRGLDYFPPDPALRLEARFEPHPPGRTLEIVNVLGIAEPMRNPGVVVFALDGREHRLEALDDTGDGRLFLIFADRTNGRTTYGAGRFLYADAPRDGRTVVDFNRAYNPPCAFTAYSTCPLPPPSNRLDRAIEAGEKRYVVGDG